MKEVLLILTEDKVQELLHIISYYKGKVTTFENTALSKEILETVTQLETEIKKQL